MRQFFILMILICSGATLAQGDKFLEKHFEDYGQDLWTQINSLKIAGKMVTADYKAYPLTITMKGNSKVMVEGTTANGRYISVLNGFNFWMAGNTKEEIVEPVEKTITQHSVTIGSPLFRYKDQLIYNGLEVVDNVVYNAFRASEGALTIAFFLDKNTHRLKYQKAIVNVGDEMYEVLFSYDKYKSLNGLLVPTAVEVITMDTYQEWVLDEVFIGIGAPDSIFENPNSQ